MLEKIHVGSRSEKNYSGSTTLAEKQRLRSEIGDITSSFTVTLG
jgi:hypothetical protein